MTGFIGGGIMAEALIKGMTGHGMRDIIVSEPREERREHLRKTYGVDTTADNLSVVSSSEIIILAVKPQDMAGVLEEIGGTVSAEKTVVSVAAGITLKYLQERLSTERLVRAMPNVAALAQEAMSVLSLRECFTGREISTVREIFMSAGRVLVLPEKHMDAVTALSGSGPAFIALFVDAMTEAGLGMGLREEDAGDLAFQTLKGTAELLAGGITPARLMEMVKSPGGTTAAGLEVFEKKGLKGIVRDALEAAALRAGELAK